MYCNLADGTVRIAIGHNDTSVLGVVCLRIMLLMTNGAPNCSNAGTHANGTAILLKLIMKKMC